MSILHRLQVITHYCQIFAVDWRISP